MWVCILEQEMKPAIFVSCRVVLCNVGMYVWMHACSKKKRGAGRRRRNLDKPLLVFVSGFVAFYLTYTMYAYLPTY